MPMISAHWRPAMATMLAFAGLHFAFAQPAHAQVSAMGCGPLANAYGPFDYRNQRDKIEVVEQFHFTGEVEALLRGKSGTIGGDIDYTLRASPNHHRALLSLLKQAERSKSPQPFSLPRPIECYFERAIRFRRDDQIVRLLYARYLVINNRPNEAALELKVAVEGPEATALTHYNAGLIYLELKDFANALQRAHTAWRLGYPATGLRDKLREAGHWQEPPSESPPEANSAPTDSPKSEPAAKPASNP